MRVLLAFACFAVFAALLVGGVVWASDDGMTPQQTLAALLRGKPEVPAGFTNGKMFKAYVDPGPKKLGAIARVWGWVSVDGRGATENAIVYTVYKTAAGAQKSVMTAPSGLLRDGSIPGVPHSSVMTGKWKGYGMTLLSAADGFVIYQALSLRPGSTTSGNYITVEKLLPSAREYLRQVMQS